MSNQLASLLKDLPPPEFEAALERALFAADVLGWHNAEKSTF